MNRKRLLRLAFLILFLVALVVLGLRFLSMAEFLSTLATLERAYLAPILLLSLAYYVLKALRWHYFLRAARLIVPVHRSVAAHLAGQWFVITPAGELVRGYLLGAGEKFALVAPTVVMQAFMDFVALALVATLIVPLFPVLAPVVLPVTIPFLVVPLLLAAPPLRRARWRLPRRLASGSRRQVLDQAAQLLGARPMAIGLLIGVPAVLAAGLALYLCGLAVGMRNWNLLQANAVYSMMFLLGGISPSPQGLGVTEGTGTLLMNYLGINPAVALAAIVLFRAATLGFSMLLGLAAFLVLRLTSPELAHVPLTGRPAAAQAETPGG